MATNGIRGILFDLGDTLLDFGPVDTIDLFEKGAHLTYSYLEQLGVSLPSFGVYHRRQFRAVRWAYAWSHIIGREFNSMDMIGKLVSRMGFTLEPEQLAELAWLWYEPLGKQATVEPGAGEMLAAFTNDGISLGVISNTFIPAVVLDRHLDSLDLLQYLPVRVYSCDVRYRKPHPRIFRYALAEAGLEAAETMLVGDTPKADIRGARRAGLIAVLKDPSGKYAGHRIHPDHTITTLAELPQIVARYS